MTDTDLADALRPALERYLKVMGTFSGERVEADVALIRQHVEAMVDGPALRERVASLEAALRPFAGAWKGEAYGPDYNAVNMGDWARAVAALDAGEAKGG